MRVLTTGSIKAAGTVGTSSGIPAALLIFFTAIIGNIKAGAFKNDTDIFADEPSDMTAAFWALG